VGDPTARELDGAADQPQAHERYQRCVSQHVAARHDRHGGRTLLDGRPLRAAGSWRPPWRSAPLDDYSLWRDEKFLPAGAGGRDRQSDEASARANASDYGLTAGFYGAPGEIAGFLDRIEAGVTYVNRPQGATTGAWPGYQPFGGWKGSGSTGKAIGSYWYLPLYLREQSRTIVEP
jgi:1-pyrroline-5-carboxylate dehydrogenase